MSWNATVTTAGTALLARWAQGGTLTITGARSGTDKVAVAQMMAQTDVAGTAHSVALTGHQDVDSGVKYALLVTPVASAYSISQFGVFGHLGSDADVLIALYQCDEGEEIAVPASSDMPDFAYSFGAVIAMDNTGSLTVEVDTTALVTQSELLAFEAEAAAIVQAHDNRITALEALGDPVGIGHGGTGATTPEAARTALGITPANIGAVPYGTQSGVDLDTVKTPGLYYMTGASCTTSGETGLTIHLIVTANSGGDRVLQIRVGISGASMMYRVLYNGWSAWKTLSNA